mgnify:CR=1 FL=1
MTAYSDLTAAIAAINRGHVSRYLHKPWNADELMATLRDAVERYRLSVTVQRMQLRISETERMYALGVLTYQMLTGRLPYGSHGAAVRTRADLRRLQYRSALDEHRPIPAWMDTVLERAVQPQPHKRQQALTEFVHDLHHPGAAYLRQHRLPLTERHPLVFWRALSLLLGLAVVLLLGVVHSLR